MTELNLYKTRQLSAVQYVLALHQPQDRVAVLVRNRVREQTLQRILSAEDSASSRFKIGSRSKIMQVPTCMLRGIELVFVYRAKNSAAALCLDIDVPTAEGPTPRHPQSELVQIQPTNGGGN
jgi:hypothetical protein